MKWSMQTVRRERENTWETAGNYVAVAYAFGACHRAHLLQLQLYNKPGGYTPARNLVSVAKPVRGAEFLWNMQLL